MAANGTADEVVPDSLTQFVQALRRANIAVDDDPGDLRSIRFKLPGARQDIPYRVNSYTVASMLDANVALWRNVSSFYAVYDPTTSTIECLVELTGDHRLNEGLRPWLLPGATHHQDFHDFSVGEVEENDDESDEVPEDFGLKMAARFSESALGWSLHTALGEVQIELSPTSIALESLHLYFERPPISLKIQKPQLQEQEAEDLLLGLGRDFLLDLDIAFGASIALSSRPRRYSPANRNRRQTAVGPPRLAYLHESKELYIYATGADRFPLLQYLAYYQILEYNFYRFSHASSIRRARSSIQHPAFDIQNDESIAQLISSVEISSERRREIELLEETIDLCTDSSTLRSFIQSFDSTGHFTAKRQSLRGVDPLKLDGPLIKEIARRIYSIRNRIVHAKDYDERGRIEFLLPSSPEASALQLDIELIRWLAQKALIQGASPRPVS